jgi:putative ABC transport system substrate-binding protein
MRRREFIAALGGAAAWPLLARAQQAAKVARVGVLSVVSKGSPAEMAFAQGLKDAGYLEGQNLTLEYRGASEQADRLKQFAAELVATKVDVIFASGSQAIRAAQSQTNSIPIVTISSNPVGLGFVASLARPGGNITGLSLLGPEVAAKRFELLKELIPGIVKAAVFWNPNDPGAQFSLAETKVAAKALMVEVQILETRDVADFDNAFRAAARESAGAVILLPAPLMGRHAGRIAELALETRLPTLCFSTSETRVGELISYGPDQVAVFRRAAYFVDRILKGTSPSDLPVEQPTKFELAINLKTARALGLEVPPRLLARADEVIE